MKSQTTYTLVFVAFLLCAGGWLAARLLSDRRAAVVRAAAHSTHFINLSQHFNDSLDDGWQHQLMPANNLGTLPRGRQVFGGGEFDVQGIIQLTSPQLRRFATRVQFPEQVRGIVVGRKSRALHFLHATGWNAAPGTWVGTYFIQYTGGEKVSEVIIYGEGTGNWWAMPVDLQHPGKSVVWQGTNAANKPV